MGPPPRKERVNLIVRVRRGTLHVPFHQNTNLVGWCFGENPEICAWGGSFSLLGVLFVVE